MIAASANAQVVVEATRSNSVVAAATQAPPTASTTGPIGTPSAALETPPSGAQPSAPTEGLQEIVVTAQKRSENVQRVPIAITTASPLKLTAAGVNSVIDLGSAVSGLKLLDIGGQISPRIRGIGSTSINPGTESPVAVFVDGVYYASSSDVGGDLSDVAQVAVLKGPQGTLFGRNATGGVIQIATRDPTDQFKLDLATGIDNYLTWRSEAYVGGPVSDTVKAGFSAQFVKQFIGWGVNTFNGEDVHRIDANVTLRGKLIFTPTDATTIRVSGDFSHRTGSNAGAYTVFPGFVQAYASPIPPRLWDINSYIQPRNTYNGGGASVTIEQDVGFAKLTSISAYRSSRQYWRFNPAVTAVPSLDLEIYDFTRQFTQELQLVSQGTHRLNWAVGAFYIHNKAGQNPLDIYIREGPYRGPGPFGQVVDQTNQVLDSIAGFGQATYSLFDHTRVTAGIRYTWEQKILNGYQYGILAAAPVDITFIPANRQKDIEQRPTWRFSVDQDLAPHVIGYASYNRGFKSGGFNTRDSSNPPFKPESLDAYEVGLKSQLLDNRLRLNGAGFYYDYSNVQVARYTTNTVIYNGARAHVYGLDVDLDAKVTEQLSLNGGISYLHSRFVDFPNAVSSSYVPSPTGYAITLFRTSAKGNTLPYSPDLSYNISLDYKIPSNIGPFAFDITDSYSSAYFAESDNLLKQRAYHFVNMSLAWQRPDQRFGIRLFANNLLDKAVASQFGSLATGYEADYPQAPRTFGVKFQASF